MSQENTLKTEVEANESKAEASAKLSIDYILEKIEKLDSDMQYLYDAIKAVGEIPSGADAGPAGDVAGAEKAKALADIVKCRETTKQQMLNFYTGLLDDLRTEKQESDRQTAFRIIMQVIGDDSMSADERITLMEKFDDSLSTIRFLH